MTESGLSPLWVDRIAVEAAETAIRRDAVRPTRPRNNRFWSTPERPQADTTREIMEVRFSGPRLVNHLTLDVATFPHTLLAEYHDDNVGVWLPLRRRGVDGQLGALADHAVYSSTPAQINDVTVVAGHPQHHGPGHWLPVALHVLPVTTTRVRLVLVRAPGTPPVDATGAPVAYSLGVRNLAVGYRVLSRRDVPRNGIVRTEDETFASTVDYLGSRVEFGLREQRATNVLSGGTWRCEPQPVNFAVVNFYVDTRDEAGEGQVIDRFFLDPTTPGPHLNVYYSNDDPDGDFEANDDLLPYGPVSTTGTIPTSADWIELSSGVIDVLTQAIQFDTQKPWWVSLAINPQYEAVAAGDRPLLDLGGNVLRFNNFILQFVTTSGDVTELAVDPLTPPNADIHVVLAYLPQATAEFAAGFHLYAQVGTSIPGHASGPLRRGITNRATRLRIGGYIEGSANADYRLRSLSLKQSSLTSGEVDDFFSAPEDYPLKPSDPHDEHDTTTNAVLRFHPSALSPEFPTGLVGGPGDRYANLVWTPVFRDYTLRKGYLHLPPTKARFFKFEFTHLVAEPYESFVPIARTVRLFSQETVRRFQAVTRQRGVVPRRVAPGIETVMGLTSFNRYEDALGVLRGMAARRDYTPTEAMFVRDPSMQPQVRDTGWIWGFQPWLPGARAPRFIETSRHHYERVTIAHRTKVGFFVGLNDLRAYRVDYLANDDTPQYVEHFHDARHLATVNNFEITDNALVGPDGEGETYAEVVSKSLTSSRLVRGVQFAAQQTDAQQLLSDDGFTDPAFAEWVGYGDATLERVGDGDVVVRRAYRRNTYIDLDNSWGPALAPIPGGGDPNKRYSTHEGKQYSALEGGSIPARPGTTGFAGGIESVPVTTSAAGRVYAAVRVSADAPLNGPLSIQIVGQDGIVLAETTRVLAAQETADIWVGYSVGSATSPLSYGEIEGSTYDDVEGTTYGSHETRPISGPVVARLVQYGTTQDAWRVHRLSLFDDPVVWSFSNDGGIHWYDAIDIRNNPNGVLIFPEEANVGSSGGDDFNRPDTTQEDGLGPGWINPYPTSMEPWLTAFRIVNNAAQHGGSSNYALREFGSENMRVSAEVFLGDGLNLGGVIARATMKPSTYDHYGYTAYIWQDFNGARELLVERTNERGSLADIYRWSENQALLANGARVGLEVTTTRAGTTLVSIYLNDTLMVTYEDRADMAPPHATLGGLYAAGGAGVRLDNFLYEVHPSSLPSRRFRWRVRGFRRGIRITALTIRPWYGGLLSGIDPRSAMSAYGPNRNPHDVYPPIEADPMWKQWDKPIPRGWFRPVSVADPT